MTLDLVLSLRINRWAPQLCVQNCELKKHHGKPGTTEAQLMSDNSWKQRRREKLEKKKEQMLREKEQVMSKLQEYEHKIKRTKKKHSERNRRPFI